jgi:hypothetical protein
MAKQKAVPAQIAMHMARTDLKQLAVHGEDGALEEEQHGPDHRCVCIDDLSFRRSVTENHRIAVSDGRTALKYLTSSQ